MNKIVRLAEIDSEVSVPEAEPVAETNPPPESKGKSDPDAKPEAANDGASAEEGINPEHLRMTEALLFASSEPLDMKALTASLPEGRGRQGDPCRASGHL